MSLDLSLHARIHAALGRIHAREGQWTAALRSFRKALELGGQQETDRVVALDYGRTLAAVGEREATEWLTRAARAEGADVHVFIEAAAATTDDALAGKLLAEGLAKQPADRPLRAALARRLARLGRSDEAIAIAEACVAEAPGDVAALAALRETYADAGRARDGLRIAAEEARAGNPPPLATRVALALAAGDRDALAGLARRADDARAVTPTASCTRRCARSSIARRTPARCSAWGASRPTPPRARSWRATWPLSRRRRVSSPACSPGRTTCSPGPCRSAA